MIMPSSVDDRCVYGAGERVRRKECASTAVRLLTRAREPSLSPHTPHPHRYSGFLKTHRIHTLSDTCFHLAVLSHQGPIFA